MLLSPGSSARYCNVLVKTFLVSKHLCHCCASVECDNPSFLYRKLNETFCSEGVIIVPVAITPPRSCTDIKIINLNFALRSRCSVRVDFIMIVKRPTEFPHTVNYL